MSEYNVSKLDMNISNAMHRIEYEKMRYEMLKKYRPDCMICIKYEKEVNKNGRD